jgi:hypothetical protein
MKNEWGKKRSVYKVNIIKVFHPATVSSTLKEDYELKMCLN